MDNHVKEDIGREQLRLVMQQVPTMQVASIVVALVLSYAVWGIVSGANILAFILSVSAVAASRVVLYTRYLKVRNEPFVARNWKSAYLLLALISGIVWGGSAFLILPHGNVWLLAFFVLVMASLSASTTVSHSSVKWGPAAWIAPAMLLYAVRCFKDGGEQETILAFLIVLYAIVMLQYSLKHHGTITSYIALRFENLKLLKEIRESESRYRGLYEKTPGMLHSIDRSGRILNVSDHWLATLGYAREEVLGRRSVEFLTEESRRYATEIVLPEFMGTGQCKDVEYRFVKKSGEVIDTLLSATSERDAEGNVVRSLAVIVDVTEQRRGEEALRESASFIRTVMDNLPVGISVNSVDPSVVFEYMNDNFPRFYRTTREALADPDSFWNAVYEDPAFREEIRSRVLEDCASGDPERMSWANVPIARKGRETAFITARNTPIPGKQLMISTVWDITERKRAEAEKAKLQEQLQQAMKMEAIGQLAGGVAHDFNNLLTAIIGNITLCLMKLSPSDPAAGLLAEAKKAAERAASLTQQLLAFSRKQIIEPKVLDLNILIADLSAMLMRLIGEHIELRTVAGADLGLVNVDAGQFEQVLVNLAVNARDAMPDGGKLVIETANADLDEGYCASHPYVRPGRYVMLAVSDTGHGMSEEVRKQIFEPFFTTKPKGAGTGLGLATIYGVVKRYDGSIEVYSEVGKGTTFRIYVPRVEGKAAKPGESGTPTELLAGSETVLVVEDEEAVRDLCVRILELLGYRVMHAANGDEALAMAEGCGERIDLVMTDVVMPGMHGRELAERLIRIHPEAKVLFTSGYTDNAIVHHGVLDEGVSFLGKPYTISSVAKKVRDVLDKA